MPAPAKFSVPALDRRSRGGLQGRMANRGCFAVYSYTRVFNSLSFLNQPSYAGLIQTTISVSTTH